MRGPMRHVFYTVVARGVKWAGLPGVLISCPVGHWGRSQMGHCLLAGQREFGGGGGEVERGVHVRFQLKEGYLRSLRFPLRIFHKTKKQ